MNKEEQEQLIKVINKYAGKVFGIDIIISKNKDDKRYIKGFYDGKNYMRKEIIRLIKDKRLPFL